MAQLFTDFSLAIACFRDVGGAMNVHQANGNTWEVDEFPDELAERITCTPREATVIALSVGGLSPAEIEAELYGWPEGGA